MPPRAGIFLWYLLYNVALHVGALVCLPFWLFVRIVRGRYRGQFLERMGIFGPDTLARFGDTPALWIHAASAGETASAAPLVRHLRAAFPERPFLFTVTSRYGKEMARKRLEGLVDAVCFSPLDLPLFDARFLRRVNPALYLMVETDLWPNVVRMARGRGARVAIASGQAGPRSFPRPFWRAVLAHVDLLAMQTDTDAAHIVRRGAPRDRVRTMGNLKFDGAGARPDAAAAAAWRAELGLPRGAPVLVAGSTLAEDEGPVLDALAALRGEGLDLHLVVAPRRQERVLEVEKGCVARGLACVRRTAGGSAPVVILDTMGELARTYAAARAAYVGGGLTAEVGLHNLLEPLVGGAPVVFGPHFGKARRIANEIVAAQAGVPIGDGAAFGTALRRILTDDAEHARLVAAGDALLARHRGAAERQAEAIAELAR